MEKGHNKMNATAEMLDRWYSAPGIQFKCPEAEEAYKKRAKKNCGCDPAQDPRQSAGDTCFRDVPLS